jgi:serine/threonine-protein kinase RIM15
MQVQNFAQDPRDMTVDPTTGLNSGNLSSSQDAEGDASRHANVIMQSRRAKIQRWRPGSSGTEGGSSTETPPVKPAFGRGVTSTGLGLRAHVDARPFRRVLSGQEHSEPAVFPLEEDTAGPADAPTFRDSFPNRSDRPIMNSRQDSQGSENVTGEPVHEIEWVDWMDEYKRYKEAKIRAEQAEQQVEIERTAGDLLIAPAHRTESPDQASGPVERERERQGSADAAIPSTSTNEDAASRPSYSPRKSEDNRPNPVSRLQLSRTISLSYGGNKGTASSSNDQKASLFKNDFGMVSRQPSLHSTRSSVFPGRKKKNIAAKMEGWWSAVKSNFSNPQHHSQQDMPDRYGSESPVRRTPTPRKLPSAPSSRRGSAVPVDNPSLPARQKTSRETDDISDHHLLRTATSHTNLQQLEVDHEQSIMSAAPANPSEKAQVPDSGTSTVTTLTPGMVIRPLPVSRLSSDVQNTFKPSTPSSLEARRRQPPLSLKLENNVLAPPRLHGRQNSNMSSGASTSNSSGRPGNHSHSRQESHASSGVYSTGVNTPGFHHWDQTPSPLMSLNATRPEQSDPVPDPNNGVPNLGNNDFTLASVRRHVRHRLTVAKEGCDRELRFIVSDITAFVEEHLHLPPAVADSDFDPEEVLQDSRTTFALSPRTAYSDLEDETDIMDRELGMHSQGKG